MSTQREEVQVELGVNLATIERDLRIGESYFQKWGNTIRNQQEKYSEWWSTELKKREDAEVAASVRAATRSNQARRLLRQREETQTEKRNTEIGGGSTPESWKSFAKETTEAYLGASAASGKWKLNAINDVKSVARVLKSEFGSAFGQIGSMLRFGLQAAIIAAATYLTIQFGKALAKIAAAAGNLSGGGLTLSEAGDAKIKRYMDRLKGTNVESLRARRIEAEADRAAQAQAEIDTLTMQKDAAAIQNEISDIINQRNVNKEGADTMEGLTDRANFLKGERDAAQADLDAKRKAHADIKDISEAELKVQKEQMAVDTADLGIKKKQEETARTAAELAKEMFNRYHKFQDLSSNLSRRKEDEFNPTLDEMADTNNPYNKTAWQLRQNMQWAKFDKLHGNKDALAGDLQRIQSLRDTLTKAKVYEDPNRALIDEIKDVGALLDSSKNGGGLPVKIPFG